MSDQSLSQDILDRSEPRVVSPGPSARPSSTSAAFDSSSMDPLCASPHAAAVASPASSPAAAVVSFPNAPPSLPLTGFSQQSLGVTSPVRAAALSPAAAAASSSSSLHVDRADREPEESKAYSRLGARSSLFGDHSSDDELEVEAPGSEVEAESDEPRAAAAGARAVAAAAVDMDPLGAMQQPARAMLHSPAQRETRALGARRSASPGHVVSPLSAPASSSPAAAAAAAAAAVPPLAASFIAPAPAASPSASSASAAGPIRGPSVVDAARESLEARIVVHPTNEAILRDLSDFVCSICSFLAWKPVQTACDHVFCESCLMQWIHRPQGSAASAAAIPPAAAGWNAIANAVCPMDRLPLAPHSLRPLKASNPLAYKILGRVEIGCVRHKHQGCLWRGEYSSGEDHVEKYCEYGLAPCVHCETHMQRRHLARHVAEECPSRPVLCEFCNQQLECNKAAAHVRDECREVMVRCVGGPQSFAIVMPSSSSAAEAADPSLEEVIDGCGAVMPRHRFAQHVSRECTKARVSCPLACHGCPALLERSAVADHMAASATAHLLLVSMRLDEESRRRQALEMQLEGLVGVLQEFAQQAAVVSSSAGGAGAFVPASPLNGAASSAVPRRGAHAAHNKSIFAGLTGALHAFKQAQGREAMTVAGSAGGSRVSPPSANQQQPAAAGPAASSSASSAVASPAAAAAPVVAASSSSSSSLRVSRSLSPSSPLPSPSDHDLLSWPAPASVSAAGSPSAHLSALDLSVGAKLDVRDSKGKWLEAEVLQLRRGAAGAGAPGSGFETHLMVHYSNWSDKWDEWIDLSLEPGRVAPFNSFSRASGSSPAGMASQVLRSAGGAAASSSAGGASRCFVLHSSVAVFYFSPRPRGWSRGSVWKVDGDQVSVRYAVAGAHYQRWFHAASDEIVQIAAAPSANADEGGEAAAASAGRAALSPSAVDASAPSPSAAAAAPGSRLAWTQRSSAQSSASRHSGSGFR